MIKLIFILNYYNKQNIFFYLDTRIIQRKKNLQRKVRTKLPVETISFCKTVRNRRKRRQKNLNEKIKQTF